MPQNDRDWRRWGAAALLAVAILAFFWFRKPTPAAKKIVTPTAEQAAPDRGPEREVTRGEVAPRRVVDAPTGPDPEPIIDEVTLEKKEVCEGEENLVRVKAHTVNGTDAFLHYHIGTDIGQGVPVRIWPRENGSYDTPQISVFGRGNVATRVDLPEVVVKKCKSYRNAFLDARINPNTTDEFTLSVKVIDLPNAENPHPEPFRASSYRWTFGDGKETTTSVPYVVHGYEDRPQTGIYSQFVVSVEITGDNDQKLIARHGLELLNPAVESFSVKGIVILMFEMNPRFPELDASGVVHEHVRLWHMRPDTVMIDGARKTRAFVEGVGESGAEIVSPSSVIGATEIPPGPGIEFDLTLDTHAQAEVFGETFELRGHTMDGYPVSGIFSILRPPTKPTRDAHDPIYNATLLAKVKLARQLLHQDSVTDEDIWALEREGKFADLKVDPVAPPTAPPTNLPKPPTAADRDRVASPAPSGVPAPATSVDDPNSTPGRIAPTGK